MTGSAVLASFLPRVVVEALGRGSGIPVAPEATPLHGAVLVADIRGFTAMAKSLASEGRVGPELVAGMLADCFARVVREVTSFGGDVLEFDGDAVVALWVDAPDEGGPRRAVVRSRAAAEAVRAAFGTGEVQLRIGIAAGTLHLTRVGGARGRWFVLGTGAPLVAAAAASRAADADGVGLSPEAAPLLADAPFHGESLDAPETPPLEPGTDLVAFLAAPVTQATDPAHGAWLSELRIVSIVFVILRGLDGGRAADRATLQRAVRTCQETLDRLDGQLDQVLQDDTGHVLLGIFGSPPNAHEDDPVRAVRAAVQVHDALSADRVAHGIGVATGRAFCGVYGTDRRRRFAVVGDVVNLAARLAQQQGSDVRCEPSTVAAVGGRVAFASLEPVLVKGLDEPLTMFRPVALHEDAPRRAIEPRMIGRTEELSGLERKLRACRSPTELRGPIVVEGEAGIGKTTLVACLVAREKERGAVALLTSGEEIERATPWHVWSPVLSRILELDRCADVEERRRWIERAVAVLPGMETWAPLLNAILPLGLPESATTAQMTGHVRGPALRDLVVALLAAYCATEPFVLVIDDAHWIDASSWELAAATARVSGLTVILVTRPVGPEARGTFRDIVDDPATVHVRLSGLRNEEVAGLVASTLDVDTVPEQLVSLVAARGDGNPLFSKELACALREGGHLRIEAGRCIFAQDEARLLELALPDTVQGVITQRLDRLSPTALLLLKVGAVLGRRFPRSMLVDVFPLPVDPDALDAALDGLVQEGFLVPEHEGGEPWFAFHHSVVRDAVYELMPFSLRRQLHAATAHRIERRGDVEEHAPLLAHHWTAAEVVQQAVRYLELSGDRAMSQGAYRDAVGFFEQALALHDPAGEEPLRVGHWHGQLGEAWYGLGAMDVSRRHVERALELLGEPVPASLPGWIGRFVLEAARQVVLLVLPPSLWRASASRERFRMRRAAEVFGVLGEVHYFALEVPQMVVAALRGVNLAERGSAAEVGARPYGALGYLVGLGRLHRLATLYFGRSRRGDDASSIVSAHVAEGLYHMAFADWARCRQVTGDGLALAGAVGDHHGTSLLLTVRADALHGEGRAEDALLGFRALLDAARTHGNPQHEIWALTGMAEVLVTLRRVADARAWLDEVKARLANADELSVIRYWGVSAVVALRSGEVDAARGAFDEMMRRFLRSPQPMYAHVWAIAGAAQVARELHTASRDRADRRRAVLGRAVLLAYAGVFPNTRVSALRQGSAWSAAGGASTGPPTTAPRDERRRSSMP